MSRARARPAALGVLHVAAEIFPLIKTGGLADVVAALPPALLAQGVDARVLLPGLPAILDGLAGKRTLIELGPAFGAARVSLVRGTLPDPERVVYAIDAPWLYAREGNPYQDPQGRDWPDNPQRFALLGWVAARLAWGELDPAWRAPILHAHDWHAGLAPIYLGAHPAPRTKTVFTIHNLAYQGLFPLAQHSALGLSAAQAGTDGIEFHGQGSFMKAGLLWADALTTVSPRYAKEICTPAFGCGLEGVLSARAGRLTGILNGIDDQVWNPASDAHIEATFSASATAGKARNKAALQARYGLHKAPDAPLFTVVSRLTDQKGIDLLIGALPELLGGSGQLVVLGSGDRAIERALLEAAQAHPAQVHVQIAYDEAQSHQLIAGADAIIVPSRFEPCGLTQMYGLRYGTLPVVRRVGGLADTVVDTTAATIADGTANGFSFDAATAPALAEALHRAMAALRDAKLRKKLMHNAMMQDHSWRSASVHYRQLYEGLLRIDAGPGAG